MEYPSTNARQIVRQFILDTFIFDPDNRERLTDELPLIEEGILDSFGIHEVLLFLEDKFGIDVEDEEIVASNFGSISAIVAFVQRKLSPSDVTI